MDQKHIQGYTIKNEIGHGGMATVYKAVQESLDRPVALKIMAPALAADPSFGERFLKEAKTVARLTHPNILAIYDIGASGHHHYMAMEYVAGGDLKARIKQGMTPDQALAVLQQVAAALDHAHRQGFVHRDIKPENILFREDGTVVLTDFGIAKAVGSGTRMTQTGMSIGTPHYMSPEQARGKTVDGRSDLYSLGVVLFEMLTGGVPYDAEDTIAVAYAHVNDPVPELPNGFLACQPLVDRLMAKNPEDRFGDAAQLLNTIQKVRAGEQIARPAPATRAIPNKVAEAGDGPRNVDRSSRRVGLLWGLGGAGVALVAAVGIYFANQPSRPVALPGGGVSKVVVSRPLSKTESAQPFSPAPSPTQQKENSSPTDEAGSNPAEAVKEAAERAARKTRIDVLLSKAEEDIKALRLTSPEGNNAFEHFKDALELDGTNIRAQKGLENIVDAYLDLSKDAISENDFDKAASYLDRAEKVIPGAPVIKIANESLNEARLSAEGEKRETFNRYIFSAEKEFQNENIESAIEKYRSALTLYPQNEDAKEGLKVSKLAMENRLLKVAIGYYSGTAGQVDEAKAKELFVELADRGNPLAKMWVARCYFKGRCLFIEDVNKAQQIAKMVYSTVDSMARKENETEAMYLLGSAYEDGLGVKYELNEAVEWYRKAAEKGHVTAMQKLGYLYSTGEGGFKNYSEAVRWYRQAANMGDSVSMFDLGKIFYDGRGVTKDFSEALKWYLKAADRGLCSAMFNLALMYDNGQGVEKDFVEALRWYHKAADNGYIMAMYNMGVYYSSGQGVKKDSAEALKWYRKAADNGIAPAMYNLGLMYANGDGVTKNFSEAIKWHRKAAERGEAGAINEIGLRYLYGQGVIQDDVEAIRWFSKAAEMGSAAAMNNLGSAYGRGKGVEKDYRKAAEWFKKAANKGYVMAMRNLARCYENGIGVHKSGSEARKWRKKAHAAEN